MKIKDYFSFTREISQIENERNSFLMKNMGKISKFELQKGLQEFELRIKKKTEEYNETN